MKTQSKDKRYNGKKLWDAWLDTRKAMVKIHAVFCELFPTGKPPSGDQWGNALDKLRKELDRRDKEQKAKAKADKAVPTPAPAVHCCSPMLTHCTR